MISQIGFEMKGRESFLIKYLHQSVYESDWLNQETTKHQVIVRKMRVINQ